MTVKKQHDCRYEQEITQMHKIIVGNGDPAHSMVAQMLEMNVKLQNIIDSRNKTWPTIFKVTAIIVSLVMVYFGYRNLHKGQIKIQDEVKTNTEVIGPALRGSHYNPFVVDTVKKKSWYDTINLDLIINSIK